MLFLVHWKLEVLISCMLGNVFFSMHDACIRYFMWISQDMRYLYILYLDIGYLDMWYLDI
jgi:hypothetical protein